jgi:hypothetical protein
MSSKAKLSLLAKAASWSACFLSLSFCSQHLEDMMDVDSKLSLRIGRNMDKLWNYCGSWCFCMVNLLSFEATGVCTVVGHRWVHAVEASLRQRALGRSSCAIGVYEDLAH